MSQRARKTSYWQDAPHARHQMVLIPTTIDDSIPADHPVRMVDEILDLIDWTSWESKYHGAFGQPPIHPSIMCKIWIFALIRRIRSSRQVEYALKHSIDFMWLASGRTVDHGTLCTFRKNNSDELKKVFRNLITHAIDLGVANLSELCVDGTRVLANANKYKTWTADRLEKLMGELDAQLNSALAALEQKDETDNELYPDENPARQLPAHLANMEARKEELAKHLENLKAMDQARSKQGKDAKENPAQIPKTDPDSRILPNKEGGYAPNYTPMATTETQNGFIVDASVEIGNVEHTQLQSIIKRVEQSYDTEVERVLADTAYTNGENLQFAEQAGIDLVGPIAGVKCTDNPAIRDDLAQSVSREDAAKLPINPTSKRFDKSAFIYDAENDCYHCPAGKPLDHRCTEQHDQGNKKVERKIYTCNECAGCPLADLCRKDPEAKKGREVQRDIYESLREEHREKMSTEEAKATYRRRQHFGETPFAAMKGLFGMRQFLLRGIEGVNQEWLWGATAFNLYKLMGILRRQRMAAANAYE